MPTTTFGLYSADVINISPNTLTLDLAYDGSNDVILVVDDDDTILEGDTRSNEDGTDPNQFGTATFADGSVLGGPSNTVFVERQFTLTAPGEPTIILYQIELDLDPNSNSGNATLVGYLPSSPLAPGVTYERITSNTNASNSPLYDDIEGTICFAKGTRIATQDGSIQIESISEKAVLKTMTGPKTVRWVGSRNYSKADLKANPKLRPVRIVAGALGSGLPKRDLLVSRQHRMLVSSAIAMRMFGTRDVLIAAIKLTQLPGIFIDDSIEEIEYFHLLFDKHETVFAEGALSESLHTGPEALKAVSPEAKAEILTIFPELEDKDYTPEPTAFIPANKAQKQLCARHEKNRKPVFSYC